MAALNNALTPLFEAYITRIDQAHTRFLDRALESDVAALQLPLHVQENSQYLYLCAQCCGT